MLQFLPRIYTHFPCKYLRCMHVCEFNFYVFFLFAKAFVYFHLHHRTMNLYMNTLRLKPNMWTCFHLEYKTTHTPLNLIHQNMREKKHGMRLPQRWASSYNRVACLYIIPTIILSISMTVAMLGKFYQYKDNKGTNWPLYGNMQVMLSLGEGAFQCLLSIALVIKQWLTDDVTDRNLVWKLFCGRF